MACPPAASELMAALVAAPLTRVTADPKLTPSAWNCTVPVGVGPAEVGETVTEKVTAWP